MSIGSGANDKGGVLKPPAPKVTLSQCRKTHCVACAKARVDNAKYRPLRRSAGSEMANPTAVASSAPDGKASQNDQPSRTCSSPVA